MPASPNDDVVALAVLVRRTRPDIAGRINATIKERAWMMGVNATR